MSSSFRTMVKGHRQSQLAWHPAFRSPPWVIRRKKTEENAQELQARKKQHHQDELDRIPIEGKCGQSKRRFSLNPVMTKLSGTSETAIVITFIVMNLEKWLHKLFLCLFILRQWSERRILTALYALTIVALNRQNSQMGLCCQRS